MSNLTRLWETRLSVDTFSVLITLDAFKLSLRTAFGTSHSSTTSRTNALLAIEISHLDGTPVVSGVGESGMPPKKFGCYESDINDIVSFFSAFEVHLQSFGSVSSTDPMSSCPSQFLPLLRSSINLSTAGVIKHLLNALDSFPTTPFGYGYKAAHCCFEIACFDAWSRLLERPLYSLLTQESSEKQSLGGSFYTIGLDTTAEMVKNCHFGLKHTPLLKIKLDANVQRAAEILHQLHSVCQSQQVEYKWSIDANAAWIQPSIALEFLEVMQPYLQHIFMVEQPFGLFRAGKGQTVVSRVENGAFIDFCTTQAEVDLCTAQSPESSALFASQLAEWTQWMQVKAAYGAAGLFLFADESVCDAFDVRALQPLVHGVNVKLEKCAGLRGALRAIDTANQLHMKVWIGTMVGSQLNSTGAAQLLPLACFGDMDGALLTTEDSQRFTGGMQWDSEGSGQITMLAPQGGLGCDRI